MLLEKRVGVLSEALEMKDAQLGEVLAAAHLDPATLQQVRLSRPMPCCRLNGWRTPEVAWLTRRLAQLHVT